jgi:hypothetical protein
MARTARQRAALRKAQLASARKRRKGGRSRTRKYAKRAAIAAGGLYGAAALLGGVFNYGISRTVVNRSARPSRKRSAAQSVRVGMTMPAKAAYFGAKAARRKAGPKVRAGLYKAGAVITGTGF